MSQEPTIGEVLAERGVSRRDFLKLCGMVAAVLSLPKGSAETMSIALAASTRVPVLWLEFQGCTGDSESFTRAYQRPDPAVSGATDPSITSLLLDVISVDYHETLMAPSGYYAGQSLQQTMQNYSGQYLCIIEGSIPTGNGGAFCCIGGRTALSIVQEVVSHARATVALGTCAWDGGLAGAAPNPTGAVGVKQAAPGAPNLLVIPGCPSNSANLVASIVYLLTYNAWPSRNSSGVPSFAYGREIHEECPRHDHYEDDEYVLAWGDQGHRDGWCLFRMGCRGPRTRSNCPQMKWNEGTSWCIGAGHGCIGCDSSGFWDKQSPFYIPLQDD
jgi:hydrogenase small subunit